MIKSLIAKHKRNKILKSFGLKESDFITKKKPPFYTVVIMYLKGYTTYRSCVEPDWFWFYTKDTKEYYWVKGLINIRANTSCWFDCVLKITQKENIKMATPRKSALTPIYSKNQYTPMETVGKKYSGFNMPQDPYAPSQSSFQDMAMSGENYGLTSPVADAPQSKGFMQGVSDWWNGTSAPAAAEPSGGLASWFTGSKDVKSKAENLAGGISALAGLYGSYKTGQYQDKMAKLQQHASDVYDQELAAKNQRLAQAQANYEASFK